MEAPPVQYVTTSDGFDIAYTVTGVGQPLVMLPWAFNDIRSVWHSTPTWMKGLVARFRLVQFDMRGRGMSGRGLRHDFALTEYVLDLCTVVDRLQLEPFVLFTVGGFGHCAIRYAIAHPERVDAVVLNSCPISISAYPRSYTQDLAAENWAFFVKSMMPPALGGEAAREWLERWLNRATYEDWQVAQQVVTESGIESELPHLLAPTLVLHSRGMPIFGPDESIKLAARIANARLVLIEGDTMGSDATEGLAAVDAFLNDLPSRRVVPAPSGVPVQNELSGRQAEVLRLIAEGKTTREIADTLVLSERTVERHIADVYAKIGARNRAEATVYALSRLGA
jgi:DNA-binding CsgD family transcriptional regulator/pimeloyl-ACP methyl ester carboxylesterase